MNALIDTNVVLDVLQNREPWAEDGKKLFLFAASGAFTGYLAATEISDLHYLIRKQFSGLPDAGSRARDVVSRLLSLFACMDTLGEDCRNALAIQNGDYEDAILIAGARRSRMDAIVTRNARHFAGSAVPVYSPGEFVRMLEGPNE